MSINLKEVRDEEGLVARGRALRAGLGRMGLGEEWLGVCVTGGGPGGWKGALQ